MLESAIRQRMTTYIYTITLDDSEAITLHDALMMYANTKERNADKARKLIERIHEDVIQASGNNFNEAPTKKTLINNLRTDLFDNI
jgi:hypothetical protein